MSSSRSSSSTPDVHHCAFFGGYLTIEQHDRELGLYPLSTRPTSSRRDNIRSSDAIPASPEVASPTIGSAEDANSAILKKLEAMEEKQEAFRMEVRSSHEKIQSTVDLIATQLNLLMSSAGHGTVVLEDIQQRLDVGSDVLRHIDENMMMRGAFIQPALPPARAYRPIPPIRVNMISRVGEHEFGAGMALVLVKFNGIHQHAVFRGQGNHWRQIAFKSTSSSEIESSSAQDHLRRSIEDGIKSWSVGMYRSTVVADPPLTSFANGKMFCNHCVNTLVEVGITHRDSVECINRRKGQEVLMKLQRKLRKHELTDVVLIEIQKPAERITVKLHS